MKILGVIESFDDRRGDGTLRSDAGESYYFHCLSIADGSRRAIVGARVRARRSVGLVGRDEVILVEPVIEAAASGGPLVVAIN